MSLEKVNAKIDYKKWAMIGGGAACTLGLGYFMYQKMFGGDGTHHSCGNVLKSKKNGLDEKLAQIRKKQVKKSVTYNLFLQFDKTTEKFRGKVKISFNTIEMNESVVDFAGQPSYGEDIFLDYAGTILKGTVNDAHQIDEAYIEKNRNGHLFKIDKKFLRSGSNIIILDFESDFSRNGEGMSHVFDEKNNENYIFTWFETYGAHTCFPCFDQLDIKGTFDLMIRHPKTWKAISNCKKKTQANTNKFFETASQEITASDPSDGITTFLSTKIIPIYSFTINCGDFESIVCPKRHNNTVQISIHCRRSTLKLFKENKDWMFESILFGLKTQEQLCGGFKYNFSKCDFIFTPNVGDFYTACENPGCITFKDDIFLNSNETYFRKALQGVIWHELGHMWYGIVVTNTWWGETWLKEAFADYLAYQTEGKYEELKLGDGKMKESDFYLNTTGKHLFAGFRAVGSQQTEMEAINHRSVSFDPKDAMYGNLGYGSYVYGKSVTAQNELFELLGGGVQFLNEFSQIILEQYKFSDLNSEQWIDVIYKTVEKIGVQNTLIDEGTDLSYIVRSYFDAPGFDTIDVQLNHNILNITQTPCLKNKFKTHCIYVSVYNKNCEKLNEIKVQVKPQALTTVEFKIPESKNSEGPLLVIPNSQFSAYVNCAFSEDDRKFFRANVAKLDKEALNVFLHYDFTAMLAGTLDAYEYAQEVLEVIATNPNYFLSHYCIRHLSVAVGHIKKDNEINFKELAKKTLEPLLESFNANQRFDVFHYLLAWSPNNETTKRIADKLMNDEKHSKMWLSLHSNKMYGLCKRFAVTNIFDSAQSKKALARLKEVSPKHYEALMCCQKVKNEYSKDQLNELWCEFRTKKFHSKDALKDREMMAAFVARSEELPFDYFEEFMTMIPEYLIDNELFDNISFMTLCPNCPDKKKLRDRLLKVYNDPEMNFSHKWLLRSRISSLDCQLRIKKE